MTRYIFTSLLKEERHRKIKGLCSVSPVSIARICCAQED